MATYHHVHAAPQLVNTMERVFKAVDLIKGGFGSILCTGQSGIVPSAIVAYDRSVELCVLRKEGEDSHGSEYEGRLTKDYIIIDDFVSSGKTLRRLLDVGARINGLPPKYVVMYGATVMASDGFRLLPVEGSDYLFKLELRVDPNKLRMKEAAKRG